MELAARRSTLDTLDTESVCVSEKKCVCVCQALYTSHGNPHGVWPHPNDTAVTLGGCVIRGATGSAEELVVVEVLHIHTETHRAHRGTPPKHRTYVSHPRRTGVVQLHRPYASGRKRQARAHMLIPTRWRSHVGWQRRACGRPAVGRAPLTPSIASYRAISSGRNRRLPPGWPGPGQASAGVQGAQRASPASRKPGS